MKKETGKKSKLWLWIVLALVALLAVAGVVVGMLFLKPAAGPDVDPTGETPTSEVYWNLDRVQFTQDSETGLSTREKAEDGLYHFRFASQGQLMELKTADKQLVNFIDTMDACGLELDADGLIIDVLDVKSIAVETAKNFYVKTINGTTVTVNSSIAMNGMDIVFELADGTAVMDVRPGSETLGQPIELDVMDVVCVYGTEEVPAKSVYVTERPESSPLYMRVDRFYDSKTASTTRVPDENGVYTIPFAINGKVEQLKCKDQAIVTGIDVGTDAKQVMGLTFDDEGYITGTILAATAIRGKVACTVYHVTAINGNAVEATRLMSGSEEGKVANFNLTEETQIIMNEDGCADFIGQRVETLQLYDRIICWTDMMNNALYIKIDCRKVDAPMYYLQAKKWDSAKQETTRVPDAKGYYVYELASGGKMVTVKTKDKAIANKMDGNSWQFFGLKVENGIVKEYYSQTCISAGYGVGGQRFVTQVMANIVRIVSGSNFESGGNYILTDKTEIYDMTGDPGTKLGAKTTLKVGDRVILNRSVTNEVTHIYVLDRVYSGLKLYYNASRKYSSTTLETTRTVQPEGTEYAGYYVFDMFYEGKQVQVRTKDKKIATIIDEQNAPIVALKVSNGVVKAAYPAICHAEFTNKVFNYNYVTEITSDKMLSCHYFSNGIRYEAAGPYKLASNCKIYNVSTNVKSHRGEKVTTVKAGDRIQALRNIQTGEITHIWIMNRTLKSPLYIHVNRIAPTNGITNRVPDADGYYSVDLFADGKIKTYRTKDAKLMGSVDANSAETFFAMEVKGDIIQKVDIASSASKAPNNVVSFMDVMKISGKTVTAQRMRPGSSNTGTTKEFTYTSATKIYDVSYYSGEKQFKPAKLQKGDRISVYADRDGNIVYIFIMYPHTREEGYLAKCSHCNKKVWWEPWTGSPITTAGDEIVHYYQPVDYTRGQGTIGKNVNTDNSVPRFTMVFDMNGKTLTSTGRNFLVYYDLIIIDSVGGGVLQSNGYQGGAGGNFMISGGTVTINDGVTLRQNNSPDAIASNGGNFILSNLAVTETGKTNVGKITLNDAKLEGWDCIEGGNIKMGSGTELVIKKATITGGDIQVAKGAKVTLNGSKIKIGGEGIVLQEGATITESKLSGDSKVTVQANGIFTEKLGNAEAQKAFYEPEFKFYPIEVRESALWTDRDPSKPDYVAEPEIPALPEITTVDNTALTVDAENNQAKCPVCDEVVTWTAISDVADVQTLVNGMHYYLPADVTYELASTPYIQVLSGVSACLHLNEHNLTATNSMAILVNGSLNIMGNGTVSGNGYASMDLVSSKRPDLHAATLEANGKNAVVNLYGGTYVKSADNDARMATIFKSNAVQEANCANHVVEIHGNGGTINMFDGVVIDARGTKKPAMQSYWGMFNLYGGTIYGGTSNAVSAGNWTDTKSGGFSIYGGTVQAASGGAIYAGGVTQGPAYLNVYGGTVNGTTSFNANAKFVLAGNPVLSRVNQPTTKTGTYNGLIILGELTEGASITIKGTEAISFQTEKAADYVKYFVSKDSPEIVHQNFAVSFYYVPDPEIPEVPEVMPAVTENLQFLGESTWALCPLCEEYVKWTPVTQQSYGETAIGNAVDGSHYYLAEDVTYTGTTTFMTAPSRNSATNEMYTSCFHLNGHNFTATEANVAHGSYGILNMLGTGTVSGNGKSGAVVTINTNLDIGGGMFLYSGTYTKAAGNATGVVQVNSNGGRIWVGPDATIETKAGVLAAKVAGGQFAIDGHLIIEGTVVGGYVESAAHTGKVAESKVMLEIFNADLQGGAKIAKDTMLGIFGETKIEGLDLTSGAVIDATELSGDAKVTVKAEGAFTKAFETVEAAEAQKAFYAPITGYYAVEVKDNALWTANDPAVDEEPETPVVPDEPEEPEIPEPPKVPALPAITSVDNSNLVLDAENKAKCPVCDEVVTWTALTSAGAETIRLVGDVHYYLAEDIVYTGTDIAIAFSYNADYNGMTTCLHLNGHNVTAEQGIAIFGGMRLNIMGNGIVSGNRTTANRVATLEVNSSAAIVNVYGGTYVKAAENQNPIAGINSAGGVLNIFDPVVIGHSDFSGKGNVMRNFWGQINIYGGTVYGGENASCVQAMSGKKSDGTTVYGTVSIYGGLIQAKNGYSVSCLTGTTLNFYGGKCAGTANIVADANVTIAGNPNMNRVQINNGAIITVGEMTEGASVVVRANGIFTQPLKDAATYIEKQYIKAFTGFKTITVVDNALFTEEGTDEGGETPTPTPDPTPDPEPETPVKDVNADLVFAEGSNKAMCPVCEKEVEWIAINQADIGTTGVVVTKADQHYYLAEDITFAAYSTTDAAGKESVVSSFIHGPGSRYSLCVHLNGHNFTGVDARFLFGYASNSNVMGNGIVASGLNGTGNGGIAWNTGTKDGIAINLYGGTYTVTAANTKGSAIAIQNNGGDIVIHEDVTVIGSATAPAIYVGTSNVRTSVLTIKGAKVYGYIDVRTPKDAATYATTVTLNGATVDRVKLAKGAIFTVAGDTVIGKLEVAADAKVTIGDLGSAAKIDVIGNGVITAANDKIATYFGNFTSSYGCTLATNSNNAIVARNLNAIDNKALTLTDNKAVCPVCQKEVEWIAITEAPEKIQLLGESHYYLANDITYEGTEYAIGYYYSSEFSKKETCLHLNGHNITATQGRALFAGNYLNVMGEGTVSGNYSAKGNLAATVEVNSTVARLNLYGGTYVKPAENTVNSIVHINTVGGVINMYDGATIDGTGLTTVGAPTCVRLLGTAATADVVGRLATFNMYGGTIQNGTNTTTHGGNVRLYNNAAFNMYGGTLTGGQAPIEYGGNIYSGAGPVNILGGTVSNGLARIGGNIATSKFPAVIKNATVKGGTAVLPEGKTAAHGGNVSVDNSELTIGIGAMILDGTAPSGHAGNVRCYNSVLTMEGGIVSGGTSKYNNGNIWVYCDKKDANNVALKVDAYFKGGVSVTASGEKVTAAGNGLEVSANINAYVSGDFSVIDPMGAAFKGVKVNAASTLTEDADWTGTMNK